MMITSANGPEREASAPLAEPGPSFAFSVLLLLGLNAVQRLIGLARSIVFCAWLSQESLGEWDMALGFLMLAGPVVSLSLPSVLGRYVEFFRQRGQLRRFLARIAATVGLLGLLAASAIWSMPEIFSQAIFGRADRVDEAQAVAATLLANLAYGLVVEIFVALRMQARASGIDFLVSLAFALIGVGLLVFLGPSGLAVVLAYGIATLLGAMVGAGLVARIWRSLPIGESDAALSDFWPKMLAFAGWAWIINWLVNLSAYADRYLIVHYSGDDADAALSLDGQYHAARLLPLLVVSLSFSISAILTPYLAHDWELGRRDLLIARMNLVLKSAGVLLALCGGAILAGAPLLFGVAWQGKYAAAREILPWTLASGCWFSLFTLTKGYLWSEEKGRLVSLALLVGFIANVALNLALLPRLGLVGVAYSSVAAQWVALLAVAALSRRHGLTFDRGSLIAAALPGLLLLGERLAPLAAVGVILVAAQTDLFFTKTEKRRFLAASLALFAPFRPR